MTLQKALSMALAISLGAVIGWKLGLFEPAQTEPETTLFPKIKAESVSFVSVRSKGLLSALERVPAKGGDLIWQFAHPEGNPVDPQAVAELIAAVPRLRSAYRLPEEEVSEDRESEYGLAKPEIRLSFSSGGKDYHLEFGKKHPFSGRRYARHSGSKDVVLVDETQVAAIDLIPFDLMDKTPLNFDPDAVTEFFISGYKIPVTQFVREGHKTWHAYSKGKEVLADTLLVKEMLRRLADLEVMHFVTVPEKALSTYGLRPSMMKLRLKFAGPEGKQLVVLFGITKRLRGSIDAESSILLDLDKVDLEAFYKGEYKEAGNTLLNNIEWSYYFKTQDSPWSAKALYPIHRAFLKPLGEYRRKNLLRGLTAAAVTKLTYSGEAGPLLFERGGAEEISGGGIEKLVEALMEFRVLSFPEGVSVPEPWGEYCSVEIVFGAESEVWRLEIGPGVAASGASAPTTAEPPRFGRFTKGKDSPILFVAGSDAVKSLVSAAKQHEENCNKTGRNGCKP